MLPNKRQKNYLTLPFISMLMVKLDKFIKTISADAWIVKQDLAPQYYVLFIVFVHSLVDEWKLAPVHTVE